MFVEERRKMFDIIILIHVKYWIFRMNNPNDTADANEDSRTGVYVNHGLTGSRNSLNLDHSNSSEILHNSYESHQETQGSSDFICKHI